MTDSPQASVPWQPPPPSPTRTRTRRAGRGDRRFAVATGVTAALTAITCPIIFLILSGIDCGL